MNMICKYKKTSSLCDETGECLNITIDMKVIDKFHFFLSSFLISKEDRPVMDWQIQWLVSIGILSQNSPSHTSSIMLLLTNLQKYKAQVSSGRLKTS